jgi:hypothetical protein
MLAVFVESMAGVQEAFGEVDENGQPLGGPLSPTLQALDDKESGL